MNLHGVPLEKLRCSVVEFVFLWYAILDTDHGWRIRNLMPLENRGRDRTYTEVDLSSFIKFFCEDFEKFEKACRGTIALSREGCDYYW